MSIHRLVDLIAAMDVVPAFQPFGLAHFVVIALTMALPFVLAAFVRKTRWPRCERIVGRLLAVLLLVNYLGYEIYLALTSGLSWEKALPFQLCDWAMIAIIVALLTGRERWLEVAYFWGIGGTAQAIVTPDLKYAFPDIRFLSFFIGHSGIVIGIAFVMIMRGFRPHFISVWRTFAWSELYFVVTILVDLITGVNYGYLLHKPEAASLLSYLSDHRVIYIFQMHLLALTFYLVLYAPFAVYDLFAGKKGRT
ncbi:MAG TPA: TIGR02206 family membrane protein [Chthoniobacterales bacterium]|nr:TIGR02206 family membrane protein [Chthoniobacterales bacterium]